MHPAYDVCVPRLPVFVHVCAYVRTFRCLCLYVVFIFAEFYVVGVESSMSPVGWKLTRWYGCCRGVAAGATPRACHSPRPLAPSGGARIDMIRLRKQNASACCGLSSSAGSVDAYLASPSSHLNNALLYSLPASLLPFCTTF